MAYTVVTSTWNGAPGLPGYTKIKFLNPLTSSEATSAVTKVRSFFFSLVSYIPAAVSVTASNLCEIFDDNGDKTGTVTGSANPVLSQGTGTGSYNGASGAWINWLTTQYVYGRPVRGRTFLVPLSGSAFQSDGTLVVGFQTGLIAAGNTLITGFPNVCVQYNHTKKDQPTISGVSVVTAVDVKDKGGVLRSRRD